MPRNRDGGMGQNIMTLVDNTMGGARDRDLSEDMLGLLREHESGWYVSCIADEMGESESEILSCVKKLRADGLVNIRASAGEYFVTLAES